ncbi:MAG: ZIP family metal transporter [Patescibacteria group bacterium]
MQLYLYSFLSVILVSLISFIGVFALSLKQEILKKYVFVLVSLAVGALLGDAFLHLLPESFLEIENTRLLSLAIIGGIFIFFILEKFFHWHHHDTECNPHHSVRRLIFVSDGVHNFVDGLLIGASFLIDTKLGFATTVAVILHEIPQEIGDFGVLVHAGYTKSEALFWNFFSSLFSVAGLITVLIFKDLANSLSLWLLPIAAGGFIYVALSDLVPELHKTKTASAILLQLVAIAVGIFAMYLLLFLE